MFAAVILLQVRAAMPRSNNEIRQAVNALESGNSTK